MFQPLCYNATRLLLQTCNILVTTAKNRKDKTKRSTTHKRPVFCSEKPSVVKYEKTIARNPVFNRFAAAQATSPLINLLQWQRASIPDSVSARQREETCWEAKGRVWVKEGVKVSKLRGGMEGGGVTRRDRGVEEGGDSEVDSSVIIIVCPL